MIFILTSYFNHLTKKTYTNIHILHIYPRTADRGRVKKNVAPWPTAASAHSVPPCRAMARLVVAKPIPLPGNSDGKCSR